MADAPDRSVADDDAPTRVFPPAEVPCSKLDRSPAAPALPDAWRAGHADEFHEGSIALLAVWG